MFRQESKVIRGEVPEKLGKEIEMIVTRNYKEYKKALEDCDYMICHAGVGSILDGLRNGSKVIAFVNESLKDNHQLEILEEMVGEGNIVGFPSLNQFSYEKLNQMFNDYEKGKIKAYEPVETSILDILIDKHGI